MRYIAAAIIMLAGAIAAGLASVSEHSTSRSSDAQTVGISLVVAGAGLFIFDFVRELRSKGKDQE
jgi:hypothetical protein